MYVKSHGVNEALFTRSETLHGSCLFYVYMNVLKLFLWGVVTSSDCTGRN